MSKRTNLAAALHSAGANPSGRTSSISLEPPVSSRRPASRDGQRVVTFYIKPEAHKQLRLLGVEQGRSVQELMVETLNDLFSKYGKSQIA